LIFAAFLKKSGAKNFAKRKTAFGCFLGEIYKTTLPYVFAIPFLGVRVQALLKN